VHNNNNIDCYVAIKRNAQPTDTNNKGQQTEHIKINILIIQFYSSFINVLV